MKIVVTVEIELPDPEEWSDVFGIIGNKAIRQDVKESVQDILHRAFENRDIEAKVKLR